MARPKLGQDIKLTRRITVRLTDDELKTLNRSAEVCGLSAATLVRVKLFTGKYPQARASKLHLHTYTELKKIGVNLNQLTKFANAGKLSLDLLKVLMNLERQQETIIAKLLI